MVACEMFDAQILAPFIIIAGTRNRTVSRQFADWEGSSKVTFHPKHWMDKQGCYNYLEWLHACYPGDRIGLTWDPASSHFSDDVRDKAIELNIILGAIPPG
jgi:hypothetical protein